MTTQHILKDRAVTLYEETQNLDSSEIVEQNGVRIVIDPTIMSPEVQDRIRRGKLSRPEANYLGKIIEDGERFLELGGGVGLTSSIVAKQNKAAAITTFEANPALIAAMKKTHSLNGVDAKVMNAVVLASKTSETMPFYVYDDYRVSSLIPLKRKATAVVQVPVLSLTEVVSSFSPTMLMVDVEGGELALLRDCDLPNVNKVYVELHKNKIGGRGIKAIFDNLSRQDFYYDPTSSNTRVVLFRRLPH